jgi:hypothetical protein
MKVDLHIHTVASDGKLTPEEIDYTNPELCSTLQQLRKLRQDRAAKMIAKLGALGMNIDWQRVQELAQGASMGRPHIAQALLEKGYVSSISGLSELLEKLRDAGLIGLEVFYGRYPSDKISRLLAVAKEHGLVPTGGSDFHGLDGESIKELPEIALPWESVERLFSLAGKVFELERFKSWVK